MVFRIDNQTRFLPYIHRTVQTLREKAIQFQLFAYYSSINRGLNPDQPEKLSKVVKT